MELKDEIIKKRVEAGYSSDDIKTLEWWDAAIIYFQLDKSKLPDDLILAIEKRR